MGAKMQKLYAHLCFPILKSTRLFQIKAIIIKKLQNSGRCGVAEEVLHKEFQTVLHTLTNKISVDFTLVRCSHEHNLVTPDRRSPGLHTVVSTYDTDRR